MSEHLPPLNWGNFLEELQGISERASAIVSGAMLEDILGHLLLNRLVDDEGVAQDLLFNAYGPLGTFSARINMAYMLGLIGKQEQRELNLVKRIRNEFAHETDASFNDEAITNRCRELKLPDMFPGTTTDARNRFHISVTSLANALGIWALNAKHIEPHEELDIKFRGAADD